MKTKLVVILLLILFWVSTIDAQTNTAHNNLQSFLSKPSGKHELAFSVSPEFNFNLFYKKRIGQNLYFRLRINDGNAAFQRTEVPPNFSAGREINGGFTMGLEKRKRIADKFWLIYGFEPGFSFEYDEYRTNQYVITLWPYMGVLLGAQCDINNRFYFNLENTPFISTELIFLKNYKKPKKVEDISARFDSALTLLTFGFRFGS